MVAFYGADDAAIDALEREPGANQKSLDLLRLYVNTPGNTPNGEELKLQIITGQTVSINGVNHKLTQKDAKELAEFIGRQPADIRIALAVPLSHLNLASAVGQGDLVEILRDIDFIQIPPGVINPKDEKTYARMKAYSWAFVQAVKEKDSIAAARLARIGRVYIESGTSHVFPKSGGSGRIGRMFPDGTFGPIRAYARGFTLNEGTKKDSKGAGLAWYDAYVELSMPTESYELVNTDASGRTHRRNIPKKKFIQDSLERYAKDESGPIGLATPAAIAFNDRARLMGTSMAAEEAKKRIRMILQKLPMSAKVYRSGQENDAAREMLNVIREMHGVASNIVVGVPAPEDRMTREEIHLYGAALSNQIDRASQLAGKQIKDMYDPAQALGGAVSQYIIDQNAMTPYLMELIDQNEIDSSKALRAINRPTNERKKGNPFSKYPD